MKHVLLATAAVIALLTCQAARSASGQDYFHACVKQEAKTALRRKVEKLGETAIYGYNNDVITEVFAICKQRAIDSSNLLDEPTYVYGVVEALAKAAIAEYLHDFARSMAGNAPQLETELRDIEVRKREIESKLEAARLALDRASRFIPSSGLDTYCPRCWLTHELHTPITPIPSDNARIDKFRCRKCNQLYGIEL